MRQNSESCFVRSFIIVVAGLLFAGLSFAVLASGYFCASSYIYAILIFLGAAMLLGLLFSTLLARRSAELKAAYCCCGNLAVVGAAGTLLSGLLFSLNEDCSSIISRVGVSATLFFFFLAVAGIFCYLRAYAGCHRESCSCSGSCGCQGGCDCQGHGSCTCQRGEQER